MNDVEIVLAEMRDLVKQVDVTVGPSQRVWVQPTDAEAITPETLPFVVVAKLNAEVGRWEYESFGAGKHEWKILVAVYLAEGPIMVTNSNELTREALAGANEWYKAMADLLSANVTLNGLVDIVGTPEDGLFQYVTDNILWDGQQYYGHLFSIPVYQSVVQEMSA